MFSRARAYLSLIRPLNLLITFVSIIAAAVLAGGGWADVIPMVLAGVAGVAIAAGANAVNDYFDDEIDRINRPDRPIPSGALTKSHAWRFWQIASAAGCLCGLAIGLWPFVITVGSVVLLYAYSRSLKATPLAGNIVVGGMTGMAFIFGGAAIGAADRAVVPAVFAFLVNVAREVVKDIEDRHGDAHHRVVTLPVRFGVRPAQVVTSLSLVLLVVVTVLAYVHDQYDHVYFRIVLVADAMLLYVALAVWWGETPAHMRRLSLLLKATMVVGLAAIFFGRRL
ncbi:MAG: geranylgeranylglycerol-phosphate geranylgeranyltransferase [Bacteroidota bacterium]